MSSTNYTKDAVIIGGGFFGVSIAIYLAKHRDFNRITLIESQPKLLSRASYNNQARVHNGYHYPRSFTTAYRSRVNQPKFINNFRESVISDFTNLYAIASRNSKVTSKQFKRFCMEIGADLESAPLALRKLFDPNLIEDVFVVSEQVFDSVKLAEWAGQELKRCNIQVRLNLEAKAISVDSNKNLIVTALNSEKVGETILCGKLFNCAYSGINQINGSFSGVSPEIKHEISEIALIEMPRKLEKLGVTVMDGPFFSIMPFPNRNLHSLSHVRYTPHKAWCDESTINPYKKLAEYKPQSRIDRMVRDVGRYFPSIFEAKYIESLYEIKTVLMKNESDDGRPILFERDPVLEGCYSILGGKIDNIYDVIEKLENESF